MYKPGISGTPRGRPTGRHRGRTQAFVLRDTLLSAKPGAKTAEPASGPPTIEGSSHETKMHTPSRPGFRPLVHSDHPGEVDASVLKPHTGGVALAH